MIHTKDDNHVIVADCTTVKTLHTVQNITGKLNLVIADPPYNKIVKNEWDSHSADIQIGWTKLWLSALQPNATMLVWGGIGTPGNRLFFEYLSRVEQETRGKIANLITWSKRRAYGVQNNYLFTREELVYLVNGDPKKPRVFNVGYTDEKRGYPGFNKNYPSKSEFKRRTNVWTDVTEIFSGKSHPTEKPINLYEIIIATHTNPGDYVVDLFAGSGAAAIAARNLDRKFVVVEKDPKYAEAIVERLEWTD